MSIDQATVAKIAQLARLRVPESEQAHVASELSGILTWVEQLDQVDVQGVEPMTAVNDLPLRWRKDEVTDGGAAADILANAPSEKSDFFTVPKVVE